ncbi:MAG: Asp-tRNA(Asn)/Glu-tRNA(Gln) amidotransferase subunit GatC [Thermoleophilia bacterium]|nr:Asp-tRNA(Asn)/Glu-tRNA(Gln) amidotransferase subunit GatC [Actinomycetota bacterium]MCL6092366.1 Asp-tRNA(Asn)/Glu-tRNA(Gln) amidotransferase subunit GatC [Actinomycetota bacterium]
MVSHDDVRYVAKLARLKIDEDELDRYAAQLSSILGHIDQISGLDIAGVEPTSHVIQLSNVLRDDEVRDSVSRELALQNGPEVEAGAFRVPPILDTGE